MSARSPLICSAVELWYKKMLKIGSLSELTGIDTKIKVAGFQRLYSKWLWLLMAVYKPSSMQSITITDNQCIIKQWYKYGLSVSFLTINNHKKIGINTNQHLYVSSVGFLETKIFIYSISTKYSQKLSLIRQKKGFLNPPLHFCKFVNFAD